MSLPLDLITEKGKLNNFIEYLKQQKGSNIIFDEINKLNGIITNIEIKQFIPSEIKYITISFDVKKRDKTIHKKNYYTLKN